MGQNPDWGLQEKLAFLIHSEISEVLIYEKGGFLRNQDQHPLKE